MLGSFVWVERRRRGWSQTALARRAGCPRAALSRLERGLTLRVDRAFVERLAAALVLPVEVLERAAGPQLRRGDEPGRRWRWERVPRVAGHALDQDRDNHQEGRLRTVHPLAAAGAAGRVEPPDGCPARRARGNGGR